MMMEHSNLLLIFWNAEGITHPITLTQVNVMEKLTKNRTLKKMVYGRIRFNKAGWISMLAPQLHKYHRTKHSSTKMTPKEAHDDKNRLEARVNLTKRKKIKENLLNDMNLTLMKIM